jgi:hypothetical protein
MSTCVITNIDVVIVVMPLYMLVKAHLESIAAALVTIHNQNVKTHVYLSVPLTLVLTIHFGTYSKSIAKLYPFVTVLVLCTYLYLQSQLNVLV